MTPQHTDDLVAEYLADIDKLVSDLPTLQRRELLSDLEAHIAAERIERDAQTPAQVLDILQRLGNPEVIAAAAHEEAPPRDAARPVEITRVRRPVLTPASVVGGFIIIAVVLFATFMLFFVSSSSVGTTEPVPVGDLPSAATPSVTASR